MSSTNQTLSSLYPGNSITAIGETSGTLGPSPPPYLHECVHFWLLVLIVSKHVDDLTILFWKKPIQSNPSICLRGKDFPTGRFCPCEASRRPSRLNHECLSPPPEPEGGCCRRSTVLSLSQAHSPDRYSISSRCLWGSSKQRGSSMFLVRIWRHLHMYQYGAHGLPSPIAEHTLFRT